MKNILGLLLLSSSLFSMELDIVQFDKKIATTKNISKKMHIEPKSVFVPNHLGSLKLSHGKKGFSVHKDNKKHVIKKYFTDPMVRDMTKEQLKHFLKFGYLSVNRMDNGEFTLKANGRINGGGPIGATIGAFLGKAAISVAGHGAIQIVAILTGPGYIPTVIALESCFGAAIEATSMAGAVAGGIALGVATGPV